MSHTGGAQRGKRDDELRGENGRRGGALRRIARFERVAERASCAHFHHDHRSLLRRIERVVEAPHIPTTDVIVSGADGRPLPDTDVWWRAADSTSTLRSANAAETTSTAVAQDVDQAWPLGDNRALIWRTSGELV